MAVEVLYMAKTECVIKINCVRQKIRNKEIRCTHIQGFENVENEANTLMKSVQVTQLHFRIIQFNSVDFQYPILWHDLKFLIFC